MVSMVGIVIATHGALADGLRSALELLMGPQEQLETLGLFHGDDPLDFEQRVRAAVERVDTGEGALVLVDILGGTPSNCAMRLLQDMHIHAIAGVNLTAVIQAVCSREDSGLTKLSQEVLAAEDEAVVDVNSRVFGASDQGGDSGSCPGGEGDSARGAVPGNSRIVLCRIDDRLIHGQVMTSWLNATSANKIMIVDDETAQNPFLRSVFKSAVPANVKIGVFSEKKAIDRLLKGFKPDDRVIILAKFPQTFLHLVEGGASLDEVIVGGMGSRNGRTKLYRNISATEEERKAFSELISAGVGLKIQILADDAQVDVAGLLK